MNDGIVPVLIGLAVVAFGVVFIVFRNGLRRAMAALLVAMYGRFGERASVSMTDRLAIFIGCVFITVGLLLGVVKFVQLLT